MKAEPGEATSSCHRALLQRRFKPVHVKSLSARAVRSLIIARKKLVGQRVTLENQIRDLAVVPLELGVMRIGERRPKGRWKDITEKQIEYLRNSIAKYERSIVELLREIDNA